MAVCIDSGSALAAAKEGSELENDGRLAIYNYHENEYAEIVYRDERGLRREGLEQIRHIMRSRGDGRTHPIDIRLIELIDHLQDHFNAETVELISGYRSRAYNTMLRESGRGGASESLHTRGMAADIHLDEVDEERLFEYVKGLGVGGAGFYQRYRFVHVDVGQARSWREPAPEGRVLTGTENNPNDAWSAITDRDVYAQGNDLSVKITNNGYETQRLVRNVWIERFRKGKWSEQEQIAKKGSTRLKQGASTTFRWRVPSGQALGKYRLVIFTSKDFEIPPAYSNEFYIR